MGTSARTVAAPPPLVVEITAATRLRLDELDRLRAVGMAKAMELDAAEKALLPSPILTPEQHFRLKARNVEAFDRIGRAVRQIMKLEFELLGLFEAPDRDALPKPRRIKPEPGGVAETKPDIKPVKPIDLTDLRLRPDYRNGPIEDVVAGIRKTLGVEAPPNDPFTPPPERKVREAAPAAPRQQAPSPAKPAPATVKLPETAEVNPAMKAAYSLCRPSSATASAFPRPSPGKQRSTPPGRPNAAATAARRNRRWPPAVFRVRFACFPPNPRHLQPRSGCRAMARVRYASAPRPALP